MIRRLLLLALVIVLPSLAPRVEAFCGFYVAKADSKLFNESSQVALVRDGDRTVLTMANDYQGDPSEFALVVPVPTMIEEGQIHVANGATLAHLDAYTAPRLVEYHDDNPCVDYRIMERMRSADGAAVEMSAEERAESLGVTIEARYTVGEYDILILSAEQSHGLETWLRENDYRIPEGASEVLGSYLKQGMRFFVAKVNLGEQAALGLTRLRPLAIAYEHDRFMLPIRLGTVNAKGPQDLIIYALTRTGRVETTNYRTVRLPTGQDLPEYVEEMFADFYRAMFAHQVEKEGMTTVFLEYAWDMGWCDPCAADPLSVAELRDLGVFWIDDPGPSRGPKQAARDVYVSRLHVRYDAEHFPEDLMFQETGDRTNFQGRYVLRRPWTGSASECAEAERYFSETLPRRQEEAARTLASLTGWDIADIRQRIGIKQITVPDEEEKSWWDRLWGR